MSNFTSDDDRHHLSPGQEKGTPFSFTTVTVDSYGEIVKKQELI